MKLTLYVRQRCHLCELAKSALARVQTKVPFDLVEIDIDTDADLVADYGTLVPVVELAGRTLSTYHVDEGELERILREHRRDHDEQASQ